jgi:hypothetical protein
VDICRRQEGKHFGDILLCGGKIIDLVSTEKGKLVVDRVCQKCGKNFGMNQMNISSTSSFTQPFLQGMVPLSPAQYKLF